MSAVNSMTPLYPFSAIVGQPQLKRALLLCAVDPSLGGTLIRGDKGTAKSTAARALTAVLPPLARVSGCAFNCPPGAAASCCPQCAAPAVLAGAQQEVLAAVPFVTLPLGATEDRVLGTLDLQRALKGEQNALQPGLLAAAHRGILYIDEVNLLPDHLVDVLLDVAAMGVNTIEREGLSVSHPARLTLIGTMNLEEGDLRPQLLDRFGLMVEVTAPRDKQLRGEVVRRRLAYEADPVRFVAAWDGEQQALRARIATARASLPQVSLDDALLDLISHLCCEFEVASLRADIVMHKAARALTALDGRLRVTPEDIRHAAELVLPHRRRRKPFEQAGLDQAKLDELMQEHQQEQQEQQEQQRDQKQSQPESASAADQASADGQDATAQDSVEQEATPESAGGGEQVFHAHSAGVAPTIKVEPSAVQLSTVAGRRSELADSGRGRTVRIVADRNPGHLAVAASVRSALLRSAAEESSVVSLQSSDLHGKIKVGKAANLILFVVDASGSMAAQRRMEVVKGAVLDLLTDAYQRRDQVAVIGFRGEQASLLLAPTRSVELAEQGLQALPTGGRTPLPHALQLALETLEQAARSNTSAPPLLVLLSDGKANVALQSGNDPWRETLTLAEQLAARGIPALVLDTESGYVRLGRAAQVAQVLGAPCLSLEDLSAETLALTIRSSITA